MEDTKTTTPDGALAAVKAEDVTLSGALDFIDRYLAVGGSQAANLWSILGALRGPDERPEPANRDSLPGSVVAHDRKQVTTARIRAQAFPKATRASLDEGSYHLGDVNTDGERLGAKVEGRRLPAGPLGNHFEGHVTVAAAALRTLGRSI